MILAIGTKSSNLAKNKVKHHCEDYLADSSDIGHIALSIKKCTRLCKISKQANMELVILRVWNNNPCDIIAAHKEVEHNSKKWEADKSTFDVFYKSLRV